VFKLVGSCNNAVTGDDDVGYLYLWSGAYRSSGCTNGDSIALGRDQYFKGERKKIPSSRHLPKRSNRFPIPALLKRSWVREKKHKRGGKKGRIKIDRVEMVTLPASDLPADVVLVY
jgi:hypothetical protein